MATQTPSPARPLSPTWELVATPPPPGYRQVCVDGHDRLWLTGDRGLLRRSRDAGKTWTELRVPGLDDSVFACLQAPDGGIYALPRHGCLWLSRDDGETWMSLRLADALDGLGGDADSVWVHSSKQLQRCRLGTDDWQTFTPPTEHIVCVASDHDGGLWLGCAEGLLHTVDGRAWRKVALPVDGWTHAIGVWRDRLVTQTGAGNRPKLCISEDAGATFTVHDGPCTSGDLFVADQTVVLGRGFNGDGSLLSTDGGRSFEVLGPPANAFAADPAGWLYAFCYHDLRRIRIEAFTALPSLPAPQPPAPPLTGPSSPEDLLLDELLVAWRATRDPALARLVAEVGRRCAPVKGAALAHLNQAALRVQWPVVANAAHPQDLPLLLETLGGTLADLRLQVQQLALRAPDPRLSLGLAEWLVSFPHRSNTSRPIWRRVGDILLAHADERTLPVLEATLASGVPIAGETLRRSMERLFVRLLEDLGPQVAAKKKPLDAAQQALVTRAAQQLHAR
jgi:hypothetical protein